MSNSNNRVIVPAARAALDQFKMEAANEVGVNLKQGYNGDLTLSLIHISEPTRRS